MVRQQVMSYAWMRLDYSGFFIRQMHCFAKNGIGYRDIPEIMQKTTQRNSGNLFGWQFAELGQDFAKL